MLTQRQNELLTFIHAKIAESGVCPSYQEMQEHTGRASKSGIHRLVTALEERGFIRRLPDRARSIQVLRLPDGAVPLNIASERQRVSDFIEILMDENRELRRKLNEYEKAA